MDVEIQLSSVSTSESRIWEMNNAPSVPSDSGANETTDPEDFIIDLRPIFKHFHCSWPLLSIFVLAFVCHYSIGLFAIVLSLMLFAFLQKLLNSMNEPQRADNRSKLLLAPCSLISSIAFAAILGNRSYVPLALALVLPEAHLDSAHCLYIIIISDLVHRFFLQFLTAISMCKRQMKNERNHLLDFLIGLSILHRSAIPIPIWFAWLRSFDTPLHDFLAWAYLYTRIIIVASKAPIIVNYALAVIRQDSSFGEYIEQPTSDDSTCVICFEPYNSPIRLHCSHTFCESCICEWLKNEDTCPMCRATLLTKSVEKKLFPSSGIYGPFQPA